MNLIGEVRPNLDVTEFWDEINYVAFCDQSEELSDHDPGGWVDVQQGWRFRHGRQCDHTGRHSLPLDSLGNCGDPRSHFCLLLLWRSNRSCWVSH